MAFDLICIGMALVDSIIKGFNPEPVSVSGFRAVSGTLIAGGESVNEAVAASKLGLKTAIFCSLGQDDAGELVRSALKKANVNTSFITVSPSTPVTTMFVNEDGTRKSITNEAHKYNFHPERQASFFTDAKAVILGSLFRAPFDDPEIIYSVVKYAKAAGQLIVADTKLPNFRALTLSDISDSLPLIDYITPNEDEARYFTDKNDPDSMADVFLRLGVKNVVIKLGAKGCYLKNRDLSLSLPAFQVDAVDSTGAGDNFVAGFVSEIIRGTSIEDALRFGNACGALCSTKVGAGTALQGRDQVNQWMISKKV